ncbi:MAG: hypothetical protein IKV94_02220 [Clostridia bacterium]|nr:hypothetical protein [Clostridia bacterium]
MKNILLNLCRFIVGPETGFSGEGNEQWYYFLSLAINAMLLAWLKPQIASMFILLMIVHFVTVCVYGYRGISDYGAKYSYPYFALHLLLLIVAIILSPFWALITTVISVVAFFTAPDCCGDSIFLTGARYSKWPLLFNAIIFAAFVTIAFMLPIALWLRILIIIGVMIVHPIIDYFAGECIIISDVTYEAWDNIRQDRKKK